MDAVREDPVVDAEALSSTLTEIIRSVCPIWLRARADDITQQAVLRVLEIVRRSEGKAAPGSSYLWKVAHSVTVDEIRKVRRAREDSIGDGLSPEAEVKGTADPERLAAGREIGREIRDCLTRFIPARRHALGLHLLGHSVPECARLLRTDDKRMENLVYRGLTDLRACLESKGLKP